MDELVVMNGIVSFVDSVHNDDPPLSLSVGGLYIDDSDSDVHVRWIERLSLAEGDEITFRIVNSDTADPPENEYSFTSEIIAEEKRKSYEHLKKEFEPDN